MHKQFLIHKLGDIYLTVDITGVRAAQAVPTSQFTSWKMLSDYFVKLGGHQAALDKAKRDVETNSTANLLF
jgi:hypothetical protein